ncbi:FIST N-terminal domain-containing protein [Pontibaca salina]|uniref:FIST C-terminal domain-containing protein n=1 Tax=Pontibaca salina TaxID=2795731 RepID=A0A934HLM9_9RHOB|nr:FIST N-terminal domain-containing protein [Pontibaca salina]MBI6629161.1 FIST C-terminal domain-containing protein [Pontibaca salina]
MEDSAANILPSDKIVGVGVSRARNPNDAVREAVAELPDNGICFALVFVPERLEPHCVATALSRYLPQTLAFGCTTAGQITPQGYESDALLIVSFPRNHFRCSSTLIHPLAPVSIADTAAAARRLSTRFSRSAGWNRFALVLSDGLSKQEEVLVAALEAGLEDIPVFGGSAAGGMAFNSTFVLHNRRFYSDAAVLILVETDLTFRGIGFNHFLPTEERMVVTRARPDERIVLELNGSAAAQEYARLVGCGVADLSPRVFAANPVLVRSHNAWHVRAIQQVTENGGLSFLCAIDDGLLLTLGRSNGILETLESGLRVPGPDNEAPNLILGFDCFLRKLEIEQNAIAHQASEVLRGHRVLGFNTFGEQHCGVHVNQTFVGVAFFTPQRETAC